MAFEYPLTLVHQCNALTRGRASLRTGKSNAINVCRESTKHQSGGIEIDIYQILTMNIACTFSRFIVGYIALFLLGTVSSDIANRFNIKRQVLNANFEVFY